MIQLLGLLVVQTGSLHAVRRELAAISQVKEVYFLTGTFDLAVRIETEDGASAQELFTQKLERISGIVSSQTHLVLEHQAYSAIRPET